MTGQLPSPSPQALPDPAGPAAKNAAAPGTGTMQRTFPWRRLAAVAPVAAAAYATFQAVLSSLPPSLSGANLHYLLAITSGLAAAGLVGCFLLLVKRGQPGASSDSAAGTATTTPAGVPGAPRTNIRTVFRDCGQALLDTVVTFNDPQLGQLTGWPHFIDEAVVGNRPTAYGTAYGLKAALAMGSVDGRLDRSALTETLWRLRRADGGWASRTQGNVSRPEVTAVTLGALAAAGCDAARLTSAVDAFEAMVAPATDPVGDSSTFVVSTVIRELVRIWPSSPRLAQLRGVLLDGAMRDHSREGLLCWAARLDRKGQPVPSPAHTALAVVALARVQQAVGADSQSRLATAEAVRWLSLARSLENEIAQIRRVITVDHMESLTVNLFTAAWTARALMAAEAEGIPAADTLLMEAVGEILRKQHDGIWEWTDGSRPMWATYQGISTLREFALSRWSG